MSTAEATFKAVYDSPLHHPLVCYLAGLGFIVLLARRLPFLYAYSLVFLAAILADATVTGSYSPVEAGSSAYTAFSVAFIILGDLRYFLLCERVTRPADTLLSTLRFSVPMSLLVPIATGILTRTVPLFANDRVLYTVYEAAMVLIVLGLQRFRFGSREVPGEIRAWTRSVSTLFASLYFGWAASDVLLLLGVEFAHVLRIVPNVLYYAVFVPFVFLRAPASARALG